MTRKRISGRGFLNATTMICLLTNGRGDCELCVRVCVWWGRGGGQQRCKTQIVGGLEVKTMSFGEAELQALCCRRYRSHDGVVGGDGVRWGCNKVSARWRQHPTS
ncbi:hypothetical protein TIFTF001_048165 [Ficus carica]|uniref:Uncharacterized protein n=1 Tax=Ficus carica TaxID=3494 RepID=A0AA88CW73_FICCA|nr:hypothetical protein TIFTF001_048165 [Ficus carica]